MPFEAAIMTICLNEFMAAFFIKDFWGLELLPDCRSAF